MDLKRYVRKGRIDESLAYRGVLRFDQGPPGKVILLLEGKCRRKIILNEQRTLYENYHPETFIGLEDLLLGRGRPGAAGVYPGSHYVLWDADDLLNAMGIQPELARRAIFELSRRIRIYDAHQRTTDLDLRTDREIDIGAPDEELTDALYEMSFAESDEFPPHLVEKLCRRFNAGETLIKQGENSADLYIILAGKLEVYMERNGTRQLIDTLGAGDLAGEMAQFDGMARSADIVAVEAVEALVFAPENFHMLFQLHPRWAKKLLNTLADRIEQRRRDLEDTSLSDLPTTRRNT